MDQLPVVYHSSKMAWFNQAITRDWFYNQFIPEVTAFQIEHLKVSPEVVKALLLFDNAPAHPNVDELSGNDGKIVCMTLPPNTTPLIQPMDQGIIEACKRLYRTKFLNEALEVIEEPQDILNDSRGERTLKTSRTTHLGLQFSIGPVLGKKLKMLI